MNTIFTTPPTVLIATRSRLLLLSTMGSPRLFTAMVLVFLAREYKIYYQYQLCGHCTVVINAFTLQEAACLSPKPISLLICTSG